MSTVQLEKGEYVTVEQAAEIIGCTPAHVRYLLGDEIQEIVGHKMSDRVWIVEKKSVEAYARKPQTRGRPRVSA